MEGFKPERGEVYGGEGGREKGKAVFISSLCIKVGVPNTFSRGIKPHICGGKVDVRKMPWVWREWGKGYIFQERILFTRSVNRFQGKC